MIAMRAKTPATPSTIHQGRHLRFFVGSSVATSFSCVVSWEGAILAILGNGLLRGAVRAKDLLLRVAVVVVVPIELEALGVGTAVKFKTRLVIAAEQPLLLTFHDGHALSPQQLQMLTTERMERETGRMRDESTATSSFTERMGNTRTCLADDPVDSRLAYLPPKASSLGETAPRIVYPYEKCVLASIKSAIFWNTAICEHRDEK
ncbi:hypothetical protein PG990_013009 [Apiospora arundinis]